MNNKNMFLFVICLIILLFGYINVNNKIPTSEISIPFGTNYFLHNGTSNTSFDSKIMNISFDITVPMGYINYTSLPNGDTLIQNWTSGQLNFKLIPGGVNSIHIHTLKIGSGGNHIIRMFYKLALVNSTGGNYTLLGTSGLSPEVLTTTPYVEADMNLFLPDTHTNLTDRIVISIYANQVGTGVLPDLQLSFDDLTDSRFIFPIGI